jgi:hypothetical protein
MGSTQQEKRRAPRASASFPLQLAPARPPVGQPPPQAATVRDISTIGLCCSLPEAVGEMTLVRLALQLPGQPAARAHEVTGVVVRCERDRRAGAGYELGVYFTDLTAETRSAIGAYVAAQVAVEVKRAVR